MQWLSKLRPEVRLALNFLGLGALWILVSNFLLQQLVTPDMWVHNTNDIFYVLGTAFAAYLLLKHPLKNNAEGEITLESKDIFENTADLIVVINRNFKVHDFNKRFADHVKKHLKIEVYKGGDYRDYVIPADYKKFSELILKVFEGEKVSFERKFVVSDTSSIYIDANYWPIYDSTGKINFIIGSAIDITERKKIEIELELNKLTLEAIYNSSEAALFISEPRGFAIIDCNQTALNLFEADHKSLILGKIGTDFHATLWTESELAEIMLLFEKYPNTKLEIEYRTLKGNLFIGLFAVRRINIEGDIFTVVSVVDITQKKIAEQKLKQSEQTLISILDTTLETSVLLDRDMKVVFVDKQLRESTYNIFNHNINSGDKILDFIVAEEVANFIEYFDKACAGELVRQEKRLTTANAKLVWLDSVYAPIKDDKGKVEYVLFSYIEITHLKEIEEKLRESEVKFRNLADSSPALLWISDAVGKIKFYNQAWLNFRGISLETEIENGWKTSIHPEDYDYLINKIYNTSVQNRTAYTVEYRLRRHDGQYRWMLENAIPKFNSNGDFEGFYGSAVDITERIKAEEKLKQSENKFKDLANTSPVMMWTADDKGSITFYNKAWLEFRDRTLEQEIGKGWIEGVHPDDIDWFVNNIYFPSFTNRTTYSSEYRLLRYDGQYRWILETGVPKFDKESEFEGMVGSAIDITDRKNAEIKLKADEQFISRVTELSPYIIYIYDLEKNQYVYMNHDYIGNLDINKKDVLGNSQQIFAQFIPQEDVDRFLYTDAYIQILATKKLVEVEYRVLSNKYGTRWVQTRDTIFAADANGKPTQILGTARDITKKKTIEQQLFEEQKLNERITKLSPDIIYLEDINSGKNIYENRSLTLQLGYHPLELKGDVDDRLFHLIHPDDKERMKVIVESYKQLADNEVLNYEFRLKAKDNSYHWFITQDLIFARDEKGIPTQLLGNTRDITERKQFEEKLLQAQKFSQQITESSPHIIYIFDVINQELLYVNNKIYLMLGYKVEDMFLQGANLFASIVYPEDIPVVYNNLKDFASLKDNEEMETEVRVMHKNGSIKWVSMKHIVFKRNEKGEPTQMLGNSSDITERKQMETKLIEEQEFSQQITQSTPSLIWIADAIHNKLVYANQGFYETLGYTPEEIIAMNDQFIQTVLHADDYELQANIVNELKKLEGNQTFEYELRNYHKNGQLVWLHFRAVVFKRNRNGEALLLLGTGQDITQRKNIEDNLIQTNRELKIANEELDGFVYRASHDLRSPLTSVLGLINVLKYDMKESHHINYINLMQKSIEKLMNVIEDLINHSKNTRLEIASDLIDFDHIISEMIQDLKYMEHADKIKFEVQIEGTEDFYSDTLRITLLFNNLISNAIKYHLIEKEFPFINIKVAKNADKCIIEVSDNGAGIEEKYQDKIFNMFYRASRNSTGSGLGLYIVKGIVEKLHGNILMRSKYGAGTTFQIDIPNLANKKI